MPSAARQPRRVTDAQLEEMLPLTRHADSVELKQVFFFATPDLRLNRQGVIVRARRVQGRGDDTVIRLRPIVPDELPLNVLKLKFTPEGLRRRLVAELWLYPDGERSLELSTRCTPGEGFQVAAEGRAYLAGRGVDLYDEQQTKTRTALEYFSRVLREGAGA
jgi:hypothetical protein